MTTTDLDQAVNSLLMPEGGKEPQNEETNLREAADDLVEVADDDQTEADDDVDESEDDVELASSEAEEDTADAEIGDENEAESADDTNLIPVIVDGKEERWTLDQLKQSASGQAAINKRFQEAAEMRKQLQSREAELAQREQAVLKAFEDAQNGTGLRKPEPPSKELLQKDPIGYMEADVQYREDLAAYQAKMQEVDGLRREQQKKQEREFQEYAQQQAQLLAQRIPDFADPQKRPEFQRRLVEAAAKNYGFTESELMSVVDSRFVEMANDARLYREMVAKRKAVDSKKQQPMPAVRAGNKKIVDPAKAAQRKAHERFRSSGSIDDAIKLIINQ